MELIDYINFFVFYALDYIISIILSFIFIQYYVKKSANTLIVIYSYFLLFGNFLLIFTLPFELIYRRLSKVNKKSDYKLIGLGNMLEFNYEIIFFFIATTSRYINPILKNYEQSGEFSFWWKIFDAIKGGLIEIILFTGIFLALALILQDYAKGIIVAFTAVTVLGYLIFLAHSMITIPKKMKIYSDIKVTVEYYEYKANRKLRELTKTHEKIINTYYECQKTFEYIQNIKEYLKSQGVDTNDNKNLEDDKNENENLNNKLENDINIEENTNKIIIDESENSLEEKLIVEENKGDKENEKDKENEEDEGKEKEKEEDREKIEKDYKKNKSMIKYKKFINILFETVQRLIKTYNVKLDNKKEKGVEPFKKYKNIVKANFQMKLAEKDIPRISNQILQIYNNWSSKKQILLAINNDINKLENKDDRDDGFISPPIASTKKINFYKKYNKILYLSLMIFFIIIDLLILVQELSLCLPINISIFSYIFKNVYNQILIHIFFIIITGFFYVFTAYSFSKSKLTGIKYHIIGGNQTDSLALIMFCQRLSTISYPVAMNIMLLIFYTNINDDEKGQSIVEKYYGEKMMSQGYYYIYLIIPILLIIIIILDFFNVCGLICKKKKKNQSFYLKNELREEKIRNGRNYLMKLNKDYLGSLESGPDSL